MIARWAMAGHMRAGLAEDAFRMACMGKGFMFHSDRGIQYAGSSFRDLLKPWNAFRAEAGRGISGTMPALNHSFFHSGLKRSSVLSTEQEMRPERVFLYIEVFYNRKSRLLILVHPDWANAVVSLSGFQPFCTEILYRSLFKTARLKGEGYTRTE